MTFPINSKNRPRPRQEGYITIIKELDYITRKGIRRNPDTRILEWINDNLTYTAVADNEIVWTDIYVTSLDWGKKAKTIKYNPAGAPLERSKLIGFEPKFSLKSAFMNKNLYKLMLFNVKYRILLEFKDDTNSFVHEDDTFEFRGCSFDDWNISGDGLLEESIEVHVEELPDNG